MTTVIRVVHQNGDNALAKSWGHPNALLFEIAEGPHAGKRGPDFELFNLVGPIEWAKTRFVLYETGEIVDVFPAPAKGSLR